MRFTERDLSRYYYFINIYLVYQKKNFFDFFYIFLYILSKIFMIFITYNGPFFSFKWAFCSKFKVSKLLPQKCILKIASSKLLFQKTSWYLALIYYSLESSEEFLRSSVMYLITFFSMYLHSFKNTACIHTPQK